MTKPHRLAARVQLIALVLLPVSAALALAAAGIYRLRIASIHPPSVSLEKSADGHRWRVDGKVSLPQSGVVYQPTEDSLHIYFHYYQLHRLPHLYAQILTDQDARGIDSSLRGKAHGERMAGAGINSIRVYHLPVDDPKEVALIKAIFRRAHERYGLRVFVGDWVGLYERPNDDAFNLERIQRLVNCYADEPWLLAWQIGNENNYYIRQGPLGSWIHKSQELYYAYMDGLARSLRAIETARRCRHPIFLGQGDLKESELTEIAKLRHFDGIGLNLFTSPERMQEIFDRLRRATSLSVMISELGLSAERGNDLEETRQNQNIRDRLRVWQENLAGHGRSGVAVGAYVYEWSDEVWRVAETGDARDGQFGIHFKKALSGLADTFRSLEAFPPKSEDPRELIEAATRNLEAGNRAACVSLSRTIVDLFQDAAAAQLKKLTAPSDGASLEPTNAESWAIDSVGTAYYLQIFAHREQGDVEEARRAFDTLQRQYPTARLRDPSGALLNPLARREFPELCRPYFRSTPIAASAFILGVLGCLFFWQGLEGARGRLTSGPGFDSFLQSASGTERAMSRAGRLVFAAMVAATGGALFLLIAWWFHPIRLELQGVSPALYWALSIAGAVNALFYLYLLCVTAQMRRPASVSPKPGLRVAMVTTYVETEPLRMVEQTLDAMVRVRYPHDTFVLDEADSAALKAVCQKMGVRHFTRKHAAEYNQASGMYQTRTKGGNINAWLEAVGQKYEFVTFFDPDHAPAPHYLDRVLGYFADSRIGFVQAPQIYRNQTRSWIARGAAERSYFFYGPVQMGLFGLDAPVLIGCHNTIRMCALLDTGGYAVHDADDLLTSLNLNAAGWRGVYVPEPLASGLAPTTWGAYFQQQFRWAHSVMDVMHHHFPRRARRLKASQVFGYGILYLYYLLSVNFAILLALPIAAAFTNLAVVNADLLALAQYSAPFVAASAILMLGWGQGFLVEPAKERGIWHRGGLVCLASWPYVIWAFARSLRSSRTRPRIVTPKTSCDEGSCLRMFWPHLLYASLAALAGLHLVFHHAPSRFAGGTILFLGVAVASQIGLAMTATRRFRVLSELCARASRPTTPR